MLSIFGSDIGSFGSLIRAAFVFGCAAAGIAIMTCAFYGWGRLTRRLAGLPIGTWPVSAALGLACVLFLGGVLNLCRVAYPSALAGVVLAGVALAALAVRQDRAGPQLPGHWYAWFGSASVDIAILGLTAFTIATQVSPPLYNPWDDFKEYLAHAVRMVETGTLYGSPLNALGGEGFGGQTFLQGFIVGYFPLNFINGADAVFCFFLCLALAGGVAAGRPAVGLAALIGTLAVFIINPQSLNISSLFSTAAVVSGLMILSVDAREGGDGASPRWREAAAPALFYAGALVLKNTNLVFCGLYFGIAAAAAFWTTREWRATVANAGWIAIWTLVFLSPWLLLYGPYYILALTHPIGAPSTPIVEADTGLNLWSLLSPAETLYAGSRLAYTCLAAGLFACALHSAMRARVDFRNRRSLVALASASAAGGASFLFWMLIGPRLQESTTTMRYSVPVLIGTVSAALPLWAAVAARQVKAVTLVLATLLVVVFAPSLSQRAVTMRNHRSTLAYLHEQPPGTMGGERRFEEALFQGKFTADVRRFQEMVPPGETVLAWISFPFLLDYRRNNIVDVNLAGLTQAWGRISQYRYVFWQYSGYGVDGEKEYQRFITRFGRRTGLQGARALDVLRWMQRIAPMSEILRDDDGMILFRTNERTLPPPN